MQALFVGDYDRLRHILLQSHDILGSMVSTDYFRTVTRLLISTSTNPHCLFLIQELRANTHYCEYFSSRVPLSQLLVRLANLQNANASYPVPPVHELVGYIIGNIGFPLQDPERLHHIDVCLSILGTVLPDYIKAGLTFLLLRLICIPSYCATKRLSSWISVLWPLFLSSGDYIVQSNILRSLAFLKRAYNSEWKANVIPERLYQVFRAAHGKMDNVFISNLLQLFNEERPETADMVYVRTLPYESFLVDNPNDTGTPISKPGILYFGAFSVVIVPSQDISVRLSYESISGILVSHRRRIFRINVRSCCIPPASAMHKNITELVELQFQIDDSTNLRDFTRLLSPLLQRCKNSSQLHSSTLIQTLPMNMTLFTQDTRQLQTPLGIITMAPTTSDATRIRGPPYSRSAIAILHLPTETLQSASPCACSGVGLPEADAVPRGMGEREKLANNTSISPVHQPLLPMLTSHPAHHEDSCTFQSISKTFNDNATCMERTDFTTKSLLSQTSEPCPSATSSQANCTSQKSLHSLIVLPTPEKRIRNYVQEPDSYSVHKQASPLLTVRANGASPTQTQHPIPPSLISNTDKSVVVNARAACLQQCLPPPDTPDRQAHLSPCACLHTWQARIRSFTFSTSKTTRAVHATLKQLCVLLRQTAEELSREISVAKRVHAAYSKDASRLLHPPPRPAKRARSIPSAVFLRRLRLLRKSAAQSKHTGKQVTHQGTSTSTSANANANANASVSTGTK